MDRKNKIRQYRQKLDKTLACHELSDEGSLKELVKKHLLKSSKCETEAEIESFLLKRTQVISDLLDRLRSASGKELEISKTRDTSREWKVKQDNEDFRVMYREGPPGTLFHDLLVEGYVNGPMDASLCVSTEATLYKYWWPQYNIPSFKVISSECLHRIRIGEHISSVKVKVSWPISSRECLLHYTEFEFFQDNLIVVVMNSISGPDAVEKGSHGFERELIPAEEKGLIRVGIVGGFALQKVTNNRSYFRTMGTMDLKLSFAPSWLVNFMARQLLGSGFKLYKMAVTSWANTGNAKLEQALAEPLYVRIREALLSDIGIEQNTSLGTTAELKVIENNSEGKETYTT